MRAIGGARADVPVCFEPWEIEALPDGATTIFVPAVIHAAELNAARPIFADRALKVLVWAEQGVSAALAQGAPDFFDWISHRVVCPGGPATFFVEGIEAARTVGVGGIVVSDPLGVAGELLGGGEASEEYVAGVNWYDEGALASDWRLAVALKGSGQLPVVVKHTAEPCDEPGWWWLDHRPIESVRTLVGDRFVSRHALLLLGGEPSTIRWVQQVAEAWGRAPGDIVGALASRRRLVDTALDLGFISRDAIILGTAPPLLRRSYFVGRAHPRRVIQQWSKRSMAPPGWQAVFAPSALLARADESAPEVGRALIDLYVRTGDRASMFHDDRAIRAVQDLHDAALRTGLLRWVGFLGAIASEEPRAVYLRALERFTSDDFRSARSLLDLVLLHDDLDLPTFLAARVARVRASAGQPDPAGNLRLRWLSGGRSYSGVELQQLAEQQAPNALAEWFLVCGQAALQAFDLRRAQSAHDELRALIERRRIGGAGRALLVELEARIALARGDTDKVLELARGRAAMPGARALATLLATAQLQSGRAREALIVLEIAPGGSGRSLEQEVPFALVLGRAALAVGDLARADAALQGLPNRIQAAFGNTSLPSAEVDQLRAEIALARGRYAQAEMLATRAEQIYRRCLGPDHPTRIENELFRKIIPGHDPEPGASIALDRLTRVLGPAHPSIVQWRLRVEAAIARKARVERSSSH
jgi:tetratricopeptide (TPR) repeat protein